MKWITQGKVKASAKTEQRAKDCSELHWWQLGYCTHDELKWKVGQYPKDPDIMISVTFCALCQLNSMGADCGMCILGIDGFDSCCEEYDTAANFFTEWSFNPTSTNFKAFQVKARIMWKKIRDLKV